MQLVSTVTQEEQELSKQVHFQAPYPRPHAENLTVLSVASPLPHTPRKRIHTHTEQSMRNLLISQNYAFDTNLVLFWCRHIIVFYQREPSPNFSLISLQIQFKKKRDED